ncbi:MAG: phosphomannomutase/phosphoglucomutase [Fibrobacterota bacterium]|nr:phosphomannomutase/phosphoglucomutase [Fibrobacterota bacterium]QQS07477.1 MAG: phosphomannomutase/phosphoglucomutase [Fibrobacterota bacterium]
MSLDSTIFRENDIRGLVDPSLSPQAVYAIGRAYATLLTEAGAKAVAIGGDVRLSTPEIKGNLIRAVRDGGIHVVDIGTVTTPVSYFAAFHMPVDGAAMVTASHNPKEYNGFKLGIGKTTIRGEEIRRLFDIASTGEWSSGQGGLREHDLISEYKEKFKQSFAFGKNGRKIKVVYDPANAAGAIFGAELLEELGCEVVRLYCDVDGNFPNHHPDPTIPKNLVDLQKAVIEHKADLGIGIDGDGDRLGVIDDTGRWIPGDLFTLVMARPILALKPGSPIIFEVKSSKALVDGIRQAGGEPIMWKVGHSLLKQKMKETHAPLAGEVSGHMFFADRWYGFDDAMYATCRVIELLDQTGKKLSELASDIPFYPSTPEIRAECRNDAEKFRIANAAAEWFRKHHETIDIDGVRIVFPDGWGLIRASNTQPDLVLRFEASTMERVEEIKNYVFEKLKEFGEVRIGGGH